MVIAWNNVIMLQLELNLRVKPTISIGIMCPAPSKVQVEVRTFFYFKSHVMSQRGILLMSMGSETLAVVVVWMMSLHVLLNYCYKLCVFAWLTSFLPFLIFRYSFCGVRGEYISPLELLGIGVTLATTVGNFPICPRFSIEYSSNPNYNFQNN